MKLRSPEAAIDAVVTLGGKVPAGMGSVLATTAPIVSRSDQLRGRFPVVKLTDDCRRRGAQGGGECLSDFRNALITHVALEHNEAELIRLLGWFSHRLFQCHTRYLDGPFAANATASLRKSLSCASLTIQAVSNGVH